MCRRMSPEIPKRAQPGAPASGDGHRTLPALPVVPNARLPRVRTCVVPGTCTRRASSAVMTDVIARIAQPQVVLGATGLTAALLRRRPGAVVRLLVSVPLTVAVASVLKRLEPKQRPRLLDRHPRESFPSGHSAAVTAYALAVVDSFAAWWTLPLAVAAITTVNVARIEEREHWITDVLSGDLLGAFGAVVGSLAARWFVRQANRGRPCADRVATGHDSVSTTKQ